MNDPKVPMPRRGVIAGAGAVGAIAAVATVLPSAPTTAASEVGDGAAKPSDGASGYRLTEHIRRYYATARI
jgi:hypothetical protein